MQRWVAADVAVVVVVVVVVAAAPVGGPKGA